MSILKTEDGGGHTMTLLELDGYRIGTFGLKPEDTVRNFQRLPHLKCRPDDVFICAAMKNGTHLTWEIVSMLQHGTAKYMEGNKMERMIEARSLETIDALPSPRTLNCHLQFSRLPQSVMDEKVKKVLVVRNPKDMVVAWYYHCIGLTPYQYDGKFENFLNLFFNNLLEYGNYFEYMLEWERVMKENPGLVHLVHYEDMQEDLPREVERLANYLGVPGNTDLCQEIAGKCTFSEMSINREYSKQQQAVLYKDNFSFFRKGKVGGWKNVFTVAQNEMFDRVWAERMKESTLKFRYT